MDWKRARKSLKGAVAYLSVIGSGVGGLLLLIAGGVIGPWYLAVLGGLLLLYFLTAILYVLEC